MSGAKHTPAEVAANALTSAHVFCQLMADARTYRHPLYWEGSSFRSHPVGVIAGVVRLANHWHVDQLCTVYITGKGWNLNVCQDSRAHGDSYPRAIDGNEIQVWRCGAWATSELEESLKPRLLGILIDVAEHVEKRRTAQEAQDAEVAAKRAIERKAILKDAIARATGSDTPAASTRESGKEEA